MGMMYALKNGIKLTFYLKRNLVIDFEKGSLKL